MKTYLITSIFFSFIILNNCNTVEPDSGHIQITPGDDSLISDSIKTLMKEDAARLTLRDIYSDSTKKENLIILPEDMLESYYRGFVHIYYAKSIETRNLVIEKYKIHTFPYPETHSLIVSVDSTTDWVDAWKNGQRLTGNQQIDSLMEKYNLQLDRYYHWPTYHAAVLSSETVINIYALSRMFEPIEGVIFAEPNGYVGDGNNIEGSVESGYIKYVFSYGWGDCPSGCINRHYWLFHVRFDGAVEFKMSYGDTLP